MLTDFLYPLFLLLAVGFGFMSVSKVIFVKEIDNTEVFLAAIGLVGVLTYNAGLWGHVL